MGAQRGSKINGYDDVGGRNGEGRVKGVSCVMLSSSGLIFWSDWIDFLFIYLWVRRRGCKNFLRVNLGVKGWRIWGFL